jgi:hypothetical protein
MDKIMKLSSRLKAIFGVLVMIPIPVAIVLWAFAQFPERTLFGLPLIGGPIGYIGFSNANFPILGEVTPLMRLCAFLATLPLAILQVYWMWQLRQLFAYYAQGKIFTSNTTACIRRTALTFLAIPIASFFIEGVLSIVLTFNNPMGQKMVNLSVGTPQVADLLTGLVLVVIAWIMNEGARLQEDAELTV